VDRENVFLPVEYKIEWNPATFKGWEGKHYDRWNEAAQKDKYHVFSLSYVQVKKKLPWIFISEFEKGGEIRETGFGQSTLCACVEITY
jgi:hypothetical protein